ncbi:MAG TPA: antitoxin Xre/MbcA/ParS toxin-binding domain-containing protein [Nitriliruptorales bacterium]
MSSSNMLLDGARPCDLVGTEDGRDYVEALLLALAEGVIF